MYHGGICEQRTITLRKKLVLLIELSFFSLFSVQVFVRHACASAVINFSCNGKKYIPNLYLYKVWKNE